MTWRKKISDAPEKLKLLCVTLFQKPVFSAEVFVSYFKGLPLEEEMRECCHGTRKILFENYPQITPHMKSMPFFTVKPVYPFVIIVLWLRPDHNLIQKEE